MSADNYRASEDAYFKLRGQFDTGRISQEQFDEKLRELMVQDAQGRYWMLGADSGKWYFYDGANWVQSDPLSVATAAAATAAPIAAAITPPPGSEPPSVMPVSTAVPESSRGFPLVPLLVGVAIVILGIGAFLLFQNRDRFFFAQQPPAQITPILPATITRAPSPTAPNAPTALAIATLIAPTAVSTSTVSTPVPVTVPPDNELPTTAVTMVVITSEPTATPELPTLLPSATMQPTQPSIATITPLPATATLPLPTRTPLPSVPPDVYVTALTIDPNPAFKNQNAAFTATFLNTTNSPRSYNWIILLYDPNKSGPNKGFGESTEVPVTIPVGQSTLTINHIPAKGPGGCVSLYARVGWKISPFEKPIFPNTVGDPVTVYFDVCP